MGLRDAGRLACDEERAATVRILRSQWRAASLDAGWPFPSDWSVPEVDGLCIAASSSEDLHGPAAELGRARANGGAGLAETLTDLAALHNVLGEGCAAADPAGLPPALLRDTALAWADVAVLRATSIEVCDALTGLATPAYLRTRLREVYAECELHGLGVAGTYVLVLASVEEVELDESAGWSRFAAAILLGDVLRKVFDGGESLAVLGGCTVAALCRRDERLTLNVSSLRGLAADRFAADPDLHRYGTPRVWFERLPRTHDAACSLLNRLGRG